MSQPIIEVKDADLITSGIPKGIGKTQAPLWMDGYNVLFREKSAKKASGYASFFTKPGTAPVRGMGQLQDSGIKKLYFGDQTKLWRYTSGAPTQIGSGFTGNLNASSTALATHWSMESWGSWMAMTNGKDAIQLDKAGTVTQITVGITRAEIFIRFNAFMLAINTDLGGAWFQWCDTDNVEDFLNDAAGNLYLRDLDSDIIAACRIGDYVAVFSNNKMGIINYLGAPFYFGGKLVLTGIGADSKAAVVAVDRQVYGKGLNGFWMTDGSTFSYIDEDIRQWMKENFNEAQRSKVVGALNELDGTIEWSIPLTDGENSVTVVYDKERKTWSWKNYGSTSLLPKEFFSNPLRADATGGVFFTNFGKDANGAALTSQLISRPFDAGNRNAWKYVDGVRTVFQRLTGTGIRLYIGTQEALGAAITWSDPITPNENWDSGFILDPGDQPALSGLFIYFKIESTAIGDDWALNEFTILGEMDGGDI